MPYWLRRILVSIPLIVATMAVSFGLMRLAPGDPANVFLDPRMSPADIQQLRHNLALDQPVPLQFLAWANRMVHGDLGISYTTGQPVFQAIADRLPATLLLSSVSLIITIALTFVLGLISAATENRWPDLVITVVSFLGLSVPTFWMGLMLMLLFAVTLDWLPVAGYYDPLLSGGDPWAIAASIGAHLVLPVCASVIGSMAALTRFYRHGMLTILQQPYILAAQARGISRWRLLSRHAFKNAALPIVTLLGLELPGLVSGAYIIEYVFSWPGLGQLGISAAFSRDYPVLMGTLVMTSVLIVIGNLISDITYHLIDPRIRRPS